MLKRVLHTGVEVYDLEQAIKLYTNIGFKIEKKFEKPEPKAAIAIISKGETAFELIQFHDKNHPYVAFIRNHVAFLSDNLEIDIQHMVNGGYKVVIPITEGVIYRYSYLQDPSGSCYEIDSEKQTNSKE